MRGVRGQNQPSCLRAHPHALQTPAVPANAVHGHAVGNFRIAVMEHKLSRVEPFDRLTHVLGCKGRADRVVAHAWPGGEGHLSGLHM